jgi:hypothetical protein
MSLQVGDTVRIYADFEDEAAGPITPTTASFTWRRPGESEETTWNYPADAEIHLDALGTLYADLPLDKYGNDWTFRWVGRGTSLERVFVGQIRVARPPLVTPP